MANGNRAREQDFGLLLDNYLRHRDTWVRTGRFDDQVKMNKARSALSRFVEGLRNG